MQDAADVLEDRKQEIALDYLSDVEPSPQDLGIEQLVGSMHTANQDLMQRVQNEPQFLLRMHPHLQTDVRVSDSAYAYMQLIPRHI